MSLALLLDAAYDQLITDLASDNLDAKSIGLRLAPGQPPANSGEYYFAVYPTQWDQGPDVMMQAIDEVYGYAVAITQRTGRIPPDRYASELITKTTEGLFYFARKVMTSLDSNRIAIMSAANVGISNGYPIYEPARWQNTDPSPESVGPEWFSAQPNSNLAYGHVLRVYFGGARRSQPFSAME